MKLLRLLYVLPLLILLPGITLAQQTVKGLVFKAGSAERIAQVVISNSRTRNIMFSDELGVFSIKALPGDTLFISKKGYASAQQVITGPGDIAVYLQPVKVIELEEVTVKGQTKRQELSDVMSTYRSKGTFYNGKPPVWSFLTSPLTGIYELFGKTPGRARRFAEYTKKELEQNEISKRYNKEFVKRITGIATDEEADRFMDFYRPAIEDMRTWNDYELVKKVKRQYEYFKKAPPAPPVLAKPQTGVSLNQ